MPDTASHVRLPILKRFEISGYELYPGPTGEGFAHTVLPGVNLIIGINGLGKTTLLNALMRVMTGPADWKSRPFSQLAKSTSTELGKWKTPGFFRERVPEGAAGATISATIAFGPDELVVTRVLSDLSIKWLNVKGVERPSHEDVFKKEICQLSGLESFEDFYVVLRYLVFFLEDRQPVVWDPTAQADILRVLFYDPSESKIVREQFELVQEKDSQIRNKRGPLNIARDQLADASASRDGDEGVRKAYNAAVAEVEGYEGRERDFMASLEELELAYLADLRELESKRVELESSTREHERLEQRHLGAIYPDLPQVVGYVFSHVASGGGCLMCGNRHAEVPRRITEFRANDSCPVCDSPPELQERTVPAKRLADRQIQKSYDTVKEYRRAIVDLAVRLQATAEQRRASRSSLSDLRSELHTARAERAALQQKLPADEQSVVGLREFVEKLEAEQAKLIAERNAADAAFKKAQRAGKQKVEARAKRIVARFEEYASSFLADRCTLLYTTDQRRIGEQSAVQQFPLFEVHLSSGVFHHTTQKRKLGHEVSESQMEFIDLAFRMALISVAAEDRPAMLVLETPEASLDAIFILRAGFLLARFAADGGSLGNRLIASSNLNRTEMIPALFGYYSSEDSDALPSTHRPPLVPIGERAARVVDLLELAEKNTALLDHGKSYRRKRDQAMYPDGRVPKKPARGRRG